MSGIYEKVIKNTKKIESLLEEKLKAEGKGLYEKTVAVEGCLEQEIVRKIRRIATIRNKLMHEDTFELADTVSFEDDCKEIIYYLSTTEFDKSDTPASPTSVSQSRNTRVCKSCGADTKPILRIVSGGLFSKETIRHICAICGSDMYITGGDRTIFVKSIRFFIFKFIPGLFVFQLVVGVLSWAGKEDSNPVANLPSNLPSNPGVTPGPEGLIFPLFILGMVYWLWKHNKKE